MEPLLPEPPRHENQREAVLERPLPPRSWRERVEGWVRWVGPGRLAGSAVVVLAVLAGAYWLVRPPAATTESKLPYAAPHSTATEVASGVSGGVSGGEGAGSEEAGSSDGVSIVVVHVAGAVVAPGVYTLRGEPRVIDAVTAAGGLARDAQPDAINLAERLSDGQRVYVPRLGEPVSIVIGVDGGAGGGSNGSGGSGGSAAGPVNLNSATADQLDTLPGVGPATAAAIIAHREQHGPFATVDDLADVRGIGPAKLEAIRGLVTV